jgi:hypothetical protein
MPRQFKSTDTSIWTEQFGNGSDGAVTISTNTTQSPTDSACTGTTGTNSLSATNAGFSAGQNILIHQTYGTGAGNWELNVISSYTSGTITTKYPLQNSYVTGAQVIVMGNYTNVTVNTGVTYSAKAWNGTVGGIIGWIANGTTTITGTLSASGLGFAGGTTTGGNGNQGASSTSITVSALTAANGSGGGGGGVGDGAAAGSGGGGGNGTAGANGTAGSRIAGTGGSTDGDTALTDFNLGAGGGGGGFRTGQSGAPGNGGNGSAGIFIFSKELVVTGAITASGANGNAKTGSGSHGCGGAGAGGSVLIKAITATLGTNLITANGGTGGTIDVNNKGGDGGVGRIHLDYAGTYTGTTTPTIDVTQDSSLYPSGGSFLYNLI